MEYSEVLLGLGMIKVNNCYLGIDTSGYTTSVAVIDEKENIIFDRREKLGVERYKRGLRQQEAVFQHINNMPKLINELCNNVDVSKIINVSSSSKPRNTFNSYMPVFNVGDGQADILANILNLEHKEFSHQEGHIAAGIMGTNFINKKEFIAIHISGGTTEILMVKNYEDNFYIDIIGGTKDISAGQLIDRIGVKLGLYFPCGKELENLAGKGEILKIKIPVSTDGTWLNFSGNENFFVNLFKKAEYKKEDIVKTLFYSIILAIDNILCEAIRIYGIKDILIVGGVASNYLIRNYFSRKYLDSSINVSFGNSKLCSDNAVGIAYLGKNKKGFNG